MEEDSTGGLISMLSGSIIGRRRMKRRNKSVQPHKHRVNREVTLPRMVTARQGQYNPLFLLACGLILMLLKAKGGYVEITYLKSDVAKGAVCLDGSPPAYHLDKGYGTGVNSWLVHLEGGGWCNNVTTCVTRKNNHLDVESMSSSVLKDQRTICEAGSVSSCSTSSSSTCITMDDDFTMMFKLREEDELLFADLGE
ncbi:hypothetical protein ACFE04_023345 [Oxalis oulophora]